MSLFKKGDRVVMYSGSEGRPYAHATVASVRGNLVRLDGRSETYRADDGAERSTGGRYHRSKGRIKVRSAETDADIAESVDRLEIGGCSFDEWRELTRAEARAVADIVRAAKERIHTRKGAAS